MGCCPSEGSVENENYESTATVLTGGNVKVNGEEKSLHQWLKDVTGWASVQT